MSFIEKRPDSELIEILWQNGHVDFNNQTNCQALRTIFESQRTQKPESLLKCGSFLANSCDRSKDDGASWFQESSNNSVDKEFSDIFYEMPTSEPGRTDKAIKEDNNPFPQNFNLDESNTIKISKRGTTDFGITSSNFGEDISSCTTRTILSSVCGNTTETSNSQPGYAHNLLRANINKTVIASSSRVSGFSFVSTAQEIATNHGYKRKERNVRKSEGHSEEDENESSEESKRAQKLESGRRSRAAEVHNLSERRRRDKINEKMKELQDLIPHSNKIDKVSVLDEAIEYLKSLQLQLQSMWMRSGMVPMLYPSVHRQMSCTDTGMNHHTITSTRCPNQLPKVPSDDIFMPGTSILNQTPFCPPQDPNSIDFATQMQNCHLPGQYSSYHGFLQTQIPQVMNMCKYGPQMK